MDRIIAHIDMNAFFASVEQQSDPRLRGKPIAVIGAAARTVITTCSYEARKFGVKTGMTVPEARKLLPSLIFVVGTPEKYTDTCARLVRLYEEYSPDVEVYSVDEVFMDLTGCIPYLATRFRGENRELREGENRELRELRELFRGEQQQQKQQQQKQQQQKQTTTTDLRKDAERQRREEQFGEEEGFGTSGGRKDEIREIRGWPPKALLEAISADIKRRIREQFGLTCSVGIAPNKLLAKLASDRMKPDGLIIVPPDEVDALLDQLPVTELCGIGDRLGESLAELGILTCGQLGRYPVENLRRRFGVIGEALSAMGRGEDESPVVPLTEEPEAKSVGHSMTFPRDLHRHEEIEREILQLSEKVGRRLRRGGLRGRTVSLVLRYTDFRTFSRQRALRERINEGADIAAAACGILRGIRLEMPVRLVGVSMHDLGRENGQEWLFERDRRRERIVAAMDRVNDRYGEFTLTPAALAERVHHRQVISPAWRPSGVRNVRD